DNDLMKRACRAFGSDLRAGFIRAGGWQRELVVLDAALEIGVRRRLPNSVFNCQRVTGYLPRKPMGAIGGEQHSAKTLPIGTDGKEETFRGGSISSDEISFRIPGEFLHHAI